MRLLLIRHGETPYNAQQLTLGREDVPLTERGRRQAEALAAALASAGSRRINAVYASPLRRAIDTATPIAEALGLPVQVEDGLIEMDVGELDGQPFEKVREHYPDFLRLWFSDQLGEAVMPGGECLRDVQERAWSSVAGFCERHADETVAAVSHNFVILTLLCRFLDLPLSGFRTLKHDLAAVSTVDLTERRTTVRSLNDRCHLSGIGPS